MPSSVKSLNQWMSIDKPASAELVVGPVMTSESSVLYVMFLLFNLHYLFLSFVRSSQQAIGFYSSS